MRACIRVSAAVFVHAPVNPAVQRAGLVRVGGAPCPEIRRAQAGELCVHYLRRKDLGCASFPLMHGLRRRATAP